MVEEVEGRLEQLRKCHRREVYINYQIEMHRPSIDRSARKKLHAIPHLCHLCFVRRIHLQLVITGIQRGNRVNLITGSFHQMQIPWKIGRKTCCLSSVVRKISRLIEKKKKGGTNKVDRRANRLQSRYRNLPDIKYYACKTFEDDADDLCDDRFAELQFRSW